MRFLSKAPEQATFHSPPPRIGHDALINKKLVRLLIFQVEFYLLEEFFFIGIIVWFWPSKSKRLTHPHCFGLWPMASPPTGYRWHEMSGFRTAECNGILCFVFGLGMIADRLWIFLFCTATIAFAQTIEIEYEEAGLFPKKEHSLAIPYQGLGMTMPYWNIFGSTVASVSYIRLTHDSQSLRGGISNTVVSVFRSFATDINISVNC